MPDIYYIILDTYTRADAMRDFFNYDNSSFMTSLEEMGFYVAECSRCNHCYTKGSLASSLNPDYLPEVAEALRSTGSNANPVFLIKYNLVMGHPKSLGYSTIAFDSGFKWSRLGDTDLYPGITTPNIFDQFINPYELPLIEHSAGLVFKDLYDKSNLDRRRRIFEPIDLEKYAFELYARS